MSKMLRFNPLSLLFACLLPAAAFAQDPTRLDAVVQAYVPERFMGSVLVARDGEVLFDKAYGSANVEWDIANTTDTKFRLGSITKQFTAAAILLLEEQGKLKTSDLLSAHMPDTPDAWKDITIHYLLNHEAGLPNFTSLPYYMQNMTLPSTPAKTIESFRDLPLDFAPGSQFRYSNSGYLVLGHLVETISGSSYADFIEENIFTPLGMTDSGYDSSTAIIPRRAAGYAPGPTNAAYVDMTVPHSAGALYSTTHDLLRWTQGLYGGELLSAESLAKMTTPNLGDYAYGLTVTNTSNGKRIMHGGGIQGFNTSLIYYPDEKLTIVALANLNGPGADTIAAHLDTLAHGGDVTLSAERLEVTLSEDILRQYVGAYQLAPNFIISVRLENGQLITQATNQGPLPIFAESETKFFPKAVEATIEFQKDAAGAVTGLVLTQNGRSSPGPKLAPEDEPPPPPVRTEITLPEDILSRYVGSYALAPNFILTVTLENGLLMTQATGQSKFPIYAETETRFFPKVVVATIDFEVDDAGTVTGLVLNQNGRSMPAPKQ